MRESIFQLTGGCCCSVGVGPSKVIARVALRMAKPNGEMYGTEDLMKSTLVSILPGVGFATVRKIEEALSSVKELKEVKCCDVTENLTVSQLQQLLGVRQGLNVWNICNGYDPQNDFEKRNKVSKSLCSVTVNYGVRLFCQEDFNVFVSSLAEEMCSRMKNSEFKGSFKLSVTLRYRSADAPIIPKKYLGMGKVDEVTGSQKFNENEHFFEQHTLLATRILKCVDKDEKLKLVKLEDLRGITIAINEIASSAMGTLVTSEKRITNVRPVDSGESSDEDDDKNDEVMDYVVEIPFNIHDCPSESQICEIIRTSWQSGNHINFEKTIYLIDLLANEKRFENLYFALKLCLSLLANNGSNNLDKEQKRLLAVTIDYGKLRFEKLTGFTMRNCNVAQI